MIDTDNGWLAPQPLDAAIIHYGGLGFSFQVNRKLYTLLMHIDGKQGLSGNLPNYCTSGLSKSWSPPNS